jgi:hypothetical protein
MTQTSSVFFYRTNLYYLWPLDYQTDVILELGPSVPDSAEFKNKLMGVMVYFSPAKNKHQSVLKIRPVYMDNYNQTQVLCCNNF